MDLGRETFEMNPVKRGFIVALRFPKITSPETLDGKRNELRDFPRGSDGKSVFW